MNRPLVDVRELAGWGFDSYEYRPEVSGSKAAQSASQLVARRAPFKQSDAILSVVAKELEDGFASVAQREDLIAEMSGMSWRLGVCDLRALIAFQRRVVLDPDSDRPGVPSAQDWPALLEMSFGPPKPVTYEARCDDTTRTMTLRSSNPNLHLRFGTDRVHPFTLHGGGPFLEVARLRERWFLRDGYHRAFALLQAGIFAVPAVILEAGTMQELGADQPWFFSEDILFSDTPPTVADFLTEDLTLSYQRPPFIRTIRITIEEALAPAGITGEQT